MKVLLYLSSEQIEKLNTKFGPSWKGKDLVNHLVKDEDMEYAEIVDIFKKMAEFIKKHKQD